MDNIAFSIKNIHLTGTTHEQEESLRRKVIISNQIVISLFIGSLLPGLFFLILQLHFLSLITFIVCLIYATILILNFFKLHTLAFFFLSVFPAFIISILNALFINGSSPILFFCIAQIALVLIPWILFDLKQMIILLIISCINSFPLIFLILYYSWIPSSFHLDNSFFTIPIQLPLNLLACSALILPIYLLKRDTYQAEKKNILLISQLQDRNYEINRKHEALQTAEEELRQNMEELETSQEELRTQKEKLEEAFQQLDKQSTKVNDSIRYAQRIQNAILPHEDDLISAFKEYFIIFKPKDVVSGDFYWYLEVENKKFLAVVDCTGHGVPGAFMSMIGNTLLYEIINAKHIFEPHLILEELHDSVLNSLNKSNNKIQDGMDVALCCIENQENNKVKVQFSGARRPLYYFSKQQLHEVQASKKSIGQKDSTIDYESHEIILQEGDILYMTTDGWIDSINPQRMRFGSQQFKEMLIKVANLPLKAQQEVFNQILDDYEQGTEQRDDVLFVGVRV